MRRARRQRRVPSTNVKADRAQDLVPCRLRHHVRRRKANGRSREHAACAPFRCRRTSLLLLKRRRPRLRHHAPRCRRVLLRPSSRATATICIFASNAIRVGLRQRLLKQITLPVPLSPELDAVEFLLASFECGTGRLLVRVPNRTADNREETAAGGHSIPPARI